MNDRAIHDEQSYTPFLQVVDSSGRISEYPLKEGESVFAGSGSACRILLTDGTVAQFHCMFNFNEGRLWAQDCGTGGETSVNGTPLAGEMVLADGDQVAIGGNTIVPVLKSEPALDVAGTTPVAMDNMPRFDEVPCDENGSTSLDACLEPDWPGESATTENERFEEEWTRPMPVEPSDSAFSQELELLRSEVEYLQSELALRDAQAGEPQNLDSVELSYSPEDQESEVMRLVNRLEELLAELQTSDERVRHLDDLLRASDEANQAEQEERRQLESWLNEIESRVSQREADMQSDVEKLRQRCESAEQHRKLAEEQIRKLVSVGSKQSAGSTTDAKQTRELQVQLDQQNRALESLQQDNAELKSQLQEMRKRENTESVAVLEQKLACMELETSRERAEIARQRSEFENLRSEFDRRIQQKAEPCADESRIAAMRQHLREIHEEEKSKELERRQNSLSGRISRLLNRV